MTETIRPPSGYSAIARIDATFAGGISRGTGFLVGDSLALTAYHVVADRKRALERGEVVVASAILLTFPGGPSCQDPDQKNQAEATVEEGCLDANADFALLRLKWRKGSTPPEPLPLSLTTSVNLGSAWHTFGYPDDDPEGIVSSGEFDDAEAIHQGAAAFQLYSRNAAAGKGAHESGYSGAPVLVSGEEETIAAVGLLRSALMDGDHNSVAGTLFGCPVASVLKNERVASLLPLPDPVLGLPGLPRRRLPEKPCRYLMWFTEDEAEVFFGRNRELAQVYRRLIDENEPRILLLYGQAGVGKSSFLDAGLQPRLKWYHEVIYLRREATQTLAETLKEKLAASPGDSLAAAWQAKEAKDGRPLIVIFDQLEEIYSRPNNQAPQELAQFCAEVARLYPEQGVGVRGRLVLSFRKEWYAELQKVLEANGLSYSRVFLQALDRPSAIEAILGLTKTERLVNQYGLQVSPALAEMMADTLLADPGSPIAPTLQILLTKMWDKACAVSRNSPHFTLEDFVALKKDGLGLGDFLDQQLANLKAAHPDWVSSGLALDLLYQHVTPALTGRECSFEELVALYQDRGSILPDLLQGLKEQALLVDTSQDNDQRATHLCHDTLALQVQQRYAASDKPGQRARRILENHLAEWKEGSWTGSLDRGTLALVENGLGGMRVPTSTERRLIACSRKRRWITSLGVLSVAIAILIAGGWGWFQKSRAERQDRIATARLAVNESARWLGTDPARALIFAVSAVGQSLKLNDPQVSEAALNSLRAALADAREENSVSTFATHTDENKGELAISVQGVIATARMQIRLWNEHGAPLNVEFHTSGKPINSLAFSPGGNMLATCTQSGEIQIWEANGQARGEPFSAGGACTVAFAEGGDRLVSYSPVTGDLTLWSLDGKQLWDRKGPLPIHFQIRIPPSAVAGVVALSTGREMAVGREPDGQEVIVAAAGDGSIGVWDLDGEMVTRPFKVGSHVRSIEINDHGGQLTIVTAGQDPEDDGVIGFWGVDGKQVLPPIREPRSQIWTVKMNPDGNMLAIAMGGVVHFTDLNGADEFTPVQTSLGFEQVAFDPNRPQAAVRDVTGQMQLLDLSPPYVIPSPKIIGQALAFSATKSVLAVGTTDGTVDLESVGEAQATLLRQLTGPPVPDPEPGIVKVAFDSTGQKIAAINQSTRIRVWDIDGKLLDDSPPVTNYGSAGADISGLRFSGRGILYLAAEFLSPEATIAGAPRPVGVYLRNLPSGGEERLLREPDGQYTWWHPCAISPDGKYIATALKDKTVHIRDLTGLAVGATLQLNVTPETVAYSSDGSKLLVLLADKGGAVIRAWPLRNGRFASLSPLPVQVKGYFDDGTAVLSASDGLLSGPLFLDENDQVTMWSMNSGQKIAEFPPRTPRMATEGMDLGIPFPIAVSADGRTLASSDDGEVKIWRAGWQDWLEGVCARLRFNSVLTPAHDPPEDRQDAITANETCQKLVWSKQP